MLQGWTPLSLLASALLLAGCATSHDLRPPAGREPPRLTGPTAASAVADAAASDPFIALTPATRLSDGGETLYVPSGTYTRLRIVSANASDGDSADPQRTVYPYATRPAISRFFMGQRHSVTLTAKVSAGSFLATVPLLTLAHDSTIGEGENFDRSIRQRAEDFPMFLVRGNSGSDITSITFELKGSDRIESTAAGAALSTILEATKVVVPTAPLLTTLNRETAREVATAIDGAVNKLFSENIAEQHVVDRPIRNWTPLVVDLHIPFKEGRWSRSGKQTGASRSSFGDLEYVRAGTWTVTFDTPRVSAFAPVTVACPADGDGDGACGAQMATARAEAAAEVRRQFGDVLNFPLNRNGVTETLASYLRQLDWWAAAVASLSGAGSDAGTVCLAIREAVSELGFNDFDAALTAEAIAQSKFVTGTARRAMAASETCRL